MMKQWKRFGFIFTGCLVIFFLFLCPTFGQTLAASSSGLKETRKERVDLDQNNNKTAYSIHQNFKEAQKLIQYPAYIRQLDSLLLDGIQKGAYPGCQVFASVNGTVVYQKSFGFYSYIQSPRVSDSTLFDIASVTKIMATTLAVMKLTATGKIKLDYTLNDYLPDLVGGTNKQNLVIRDLLLHQAGLKAWIPFYKNTLDSVTKRPRADLYRTQAESGFTVPVAANLFMKNVYEDTIWQTILKSPLENLGKYVYSDLDFYFLQKVVERVTGMPLDQFVQRYFYTPMGLKHTLFNPWKAGLVNQASPTEWDQYFRYQLLEGYVHDQGAAMLGGVAGHAGLFSDATDLGKILQMLLNGGVYKHKTYLDSGIINQFTGYNSNISRRGLGFDKPVKSGSGGPTPGIVGKAAFGHQGFTGTCAWGDPETGIVFVFLSNRVNPSADNWKITQMDIRTKAQKLIYNALGYGVAK